MTRIILILVACLSLTACKNKEQLDADSVNSRKKTSQKNIENVEHSEKKNTKDNLSTAEAIAYANGLEHWDDVREIKFTFNVQRGDGPTSSRTWQWQPKSDNVVMMTAKDTVRYNRAALDSISRNADRAFINDKYWLHAPFNLIWDEGTTITETQNTVAPISKERLNQITITYNDSLGYTPGDAYDLYYDSNFKVREWVFRKNNAQEPTMLTTWEDYKTYDGVELATMHKDSTGDFKLFFTEVSVKTKSPKAEID